ncbi:SycD/LcrH family type III secretion system chaperone [Bremerella sp. JC770]|uniref:SycD/LcrH family type III secretion system chaperone n=1 Tax=Bremerella sp. JC770 TaxID=3232137 RepID=UPI003459BA90
MSIASPVQGPTDEAARLAKMTAMILSEGYTFANAYRLDQQYLEALYAFGYDLQKRDQYSRAERVFRYLCFLNHYDSKLWIALGFCCERQKQHKKALEAYMVASLVDVKNPIPVLRSAECLILLDELSLARRSAELAAKLSRGKSEYQQRFERSQRLIQVIDKKQQKHK